MGAVLLFVMATFNDLQVRVQKLLKRQTFYDPLGNDVTSTALPTFINFALRSIQRFIVVKTAVETSASIVVGPTTHPFPVTNLPNTFRYGLDLWSSSAGTRGTAAAPLPRYQTIRDYHRDFPPASLNIPGAPLPGPPQSYVIYQNELFLGPIPDINYTLVWDYVMQLPDLVNPTDTNVYTLLYDDAVTYLACLEAATWLMEDQLKEFYKGLAGEKIKDILRVFREEEVSEGDLVAQLFG